MQVILFADRRTALSQIQPPAQVQRCQFRCSRVEQRIRVFCRPRHIPRHRLRLLVTGQLESTGSCSATNNPEKPAPSRHSRSSPHYQFPRNYLRLVMLILRLAGKFHYRKLPGL